MTDDQRPKTNDRRLTTNDRQPVTNDRRLTTSMDDLIEEAMREGVFDNLPGRGKPLKLSKNPYAAEAELAYQLLKDNNYTLPWIAERNDLLVKINEIREEIGRVWARYQAEYQVAQGETIRMGLAQGWNRHLDQWQAEINKLNKAIGDVNLKQPGEKLEILKLTLEHELKRAGAGRDLGRGETGRGTR